MGPELNGHAIQRAAYPHALEHDCPTCGQPVGEPCLPMSLTIPHLLRIDRAKRPGPKVGLTVVNGGSA